MFSRCVQNIVNMTEEEIFSDNLVITLIIVNICNKIATALQLDDLLKNQLNIEIERKIRNVLLLNSMKLSDSSIMVVVDKMVTELTDNTRDEKIQASLIKPIIQKFVSNDERGNIVHLIFVLIVETILKY